MYKNRGFHNCKFTRFCPIMYMMHYIQLISNYNYLNNGRDPEHDYNFDYNYGNYGKLYKYHYSPYYHYYPYYHRPWWKYHK